MTDDPYTPPRAELVEAEHSVRAMYSPTQAAVGAALGGPVGVAYFLRANFLTLGKPEAARLTAWLGLAGTMLVLVMALGLPDRFPSSPFTLAYILIARSVANRWQMSKQAIEASASHCFHSNWRVFGMALACLLATVILLGGGAVLAYYAGWVRP